MKLSILICTLPKRHNLFQSLPHDLYNQIGNSSVEVIWDDNEFDSIGEKRNRLLSKANGDYVCFIDDDDNISSNYVQLLMEGINKGVDCCSLMGLITTDGGSPEVFEHSIKYKEYKTNENVKSIESVKYERYPNHLNCIRADIAKQFKFPEINHGEDTDWATQIHNSGLLKTEHYINQVIYFYKFISNK